MSLHGEILHLFYEKMKISKFDLQRVVQGSFLLCQPQSLRRNVIIIRTIIDKSTCSHVFTYLK